MLGERNVETETLKNLSGRLGTCIDPKQSINRRENRKKEYRKELSMRRSEDMLVHLHHPPGPYH